MAFIEDSLEFTLGGNGALSGTWAYADVAVRTSGGKVYWEISMRTPQNGSGKIPSINLYFKIDDDVIYNSKHHTNYGQGFPCKAGSKASGSVTLKDANDTSIPIVFNMGVAQKSPQYKTSKALTRTYYTDVGTGTVVIKDNGNNTFSISGNKGDAGTNNPSTGPTISWGYSSSCGNTGSPTNQKLTIIDSTAATRTVYARCVTGATYGSSTTASDSESIKQYVAPSAPGTPALSYNKSRLTVKEPWTFTWKAATRANTSSPICGYRIRLYKNDKLVLGLKPLQANSPAKVVLNAEGTNEFLDRDNTNNTLVIEDPASFGFKASDTVKLSVYAYTKYGTGNKLFSNTSAVSAKYTVQNAGIVNVKVGGSWKEGQVYVKINDAWKEAESVHTKAGGAWKEAQ